MAFRFLEPTTKIFYIEFSRNVSLSTCNY